MTGDSVDTIVVGTGPAGLMAAHAASQAGARVRVFETRPSPGRKLLIAGSSGLNVTYDAPLDRFKQYFAPRRIDPYLDAFPPQAWLAFIESLGVKTFKGTSRRWFVEGMKAPPLLNAWTAALRARGVEIHCGRSLSSFDKRADGRVRLRFDDGSEETCDAATLCLGGAAWEKPPSRIPDLFRAHGLAFADFRPSNAGFQVDWPPPLLQEAEGKPIKNVLVRSAKGERAGDLVITAYGIEGTPIYAVGETGTVHLDLKPDLSLEQTANRLQSSRQNLSPMRRVKRTLKLGEGALALFYHLAPREDLSDLQRVAMLVKSFPLRLGARQPLEECISAAGGLSWDEIDDNLMLRRFPGIYVAGEMLDWDAPTGGFLIQACVSTGHVAGRAMAQKTTR